MKPLAQQARRLAPPGTTFTWVPAGENKHADRLVNAALDGARRHGPLRPRIREPRGWSGGWPAKPTTFLLVRHGVTDHTLDKRFSGGLASCNPRLNDEGRAQVRATAEWLAPIAGGSTRWSSSPVRRTRESAEILGEVLGFEVGRTGWRRWSSAPGTG